MPFKIVRNDITKMTTEAIVNTANCMPAVGHGCDTAVYKAAGYEELLASCKIYYSYCQSAVHRRETWRGRASAVLLSKESCIGSRIWDTVHCISIDRDRQLRISERGGNADRSR